MVPLQYLSSLVKLEFHGANMDILVRILADTSDTKLFLWQAERRRHSREDVGVGAMECELYSALYTFDAENRTQ